jgi:hypothetical protein
MPSLPPAPHTSRQCSTLIREHSASCKGGRAGGRGCKEKVGTRSGKVLCMGRSCSQSQDPRSVSRRDQGHLVCIYTCSEL